MEVPKGYVASAVRLPTSSRNKAGRIENWQGQAWRFWESVGELRAVSTWTGNVLSRARLVPAERQGRMLEPITDPDHPATQAMYAFYGGPQGQAEMLQLYGIHTTVAGEEYIVYRHATQTWSTLASGKVTQLTSRKGNSLGLQADFGTGGGSTPLVVGDLAIRIWTPNPNDPTRADAPTRACLTTLAQITAYDQHIAAQVRSRLSGNGILFLSNEVDFPAPPDADPAATPAQHFMAMLSEAMLTPIENPGDPSAVVPIVAMVPTESLGKNEWIKFWSDLDQSVIEMRDAAIKRLALGLDTPPEVLLGIADANHWNAWLSEESAVKTHIEPRLAVFAYGVTEQYLQPALQGEVPNPDDFFVIADTSSIRLRPNRSAEAIELYNLGELSGDALRRETGFQPEDTPPEDELKRWLLRRITVGAVSPEQTAAALRLLGVDLGPGEFPEAGQGQPTHTRTDTVPALPDRNPPPLDAGRVDRGLAAACDTLVWRALEKAGNRIKNSHPRTDMRKVPAVDVYLHAPPGDATLLLEGVWACAPDVLRAYTDDVPGVIDTLDFYTKGLLSSRRAHSSVVLGALLDSRPVPIGAAES